MYIINELVLSKTVVVHTTHTLKEETDMPTRLHSALFPSHSWKEEEEKGNLFHPPRWPGNEARGCWSMNSCKDGALEIL